MARIGDPKYIIRLQDLLQTRDPMAFPLEVDPSGVGLQISIPADLLLARAWRRSSGTGELVKLAPADPAAGTQFLVQVPSDELWFVRSIYFRFVAAAPIANRFPVYGVNEDAVPNEVMRQAGDGAISAGQTFDVQFAMGCPLVTTHPSIYTIPIAQVYLLGGWWLTTGCSGLQAGDQISTIRILYERFGSPS